MTFAGWSSTIRMLTFSLGGIVSLCSQFGEPFIGA
jgi:hypothetical protein